MIHNPVYNPTYTVFYKACPMGMRITDLPCYRVTGVSAIGSYRRRIWAPEETAFLQKQVIEGGMPIKAAAAALHRRYRTMAQRVHRLREESSAGKAQARRGLNGR